MVGCGAAANKKAELAGPAVAGKWLRRRYYLRRAGGQLGRLLQGSLRIDSPRSRRLSGHRVPLGRAGLDGTLDGKYAMQAC